MPFALPTVARLVLAAVLAVAALNPFAPPATAWTVREANADDDDCEVELVAPASVRQTLRPHRMAVRSADTPRAVAPRESTGDRHPLIVRNPFADPLGERLRC